MNKTIITYKKSRPQKIGEKEKQPIINVYLNRPTKYSVKKLAVKSVKQKNLFETAAVWRVSYFSVAMNNNFRNILSALIWRLPRIFLRGYFSIKPKIPLMGRKVRYISKDPEVLFRHQQEKTKCFSI